MGEAFVLDRPEPVGKTDAAYGRSSAERRVELAEGVKGGGARKEEDLAWREQPVEQRLSHALVHGITTCIVEDAAEVRQKIFDRGGRTIEVLDGPLMEGMKGVVELVGAGQMLLPQGVQ